MSDWPIVDNAVSLYVLRERAHDGYDFDTYEPATPTEILSAAADLDGAFMRTVLVQEEGDLDAPGRYLMIPLDPAIADARRIEEEG